MSRARAAPNAQTPSSVRVLMLVEAGIIGFLSFWVASEYTYNAYFRTYAAQILESNATAYSAVLGLGIGVAGSATAALLYKNLQSAKKRLSTVVAPKVRGAVDKMLPGVPGMDQGSQSIMVGQTTSSSQTNTHSTSTTSFVPVAQNGEQKKDPT